MTTVCSEFYTLSWQPRFGVKINPNLNFQELLFSFIGLRIPFILFFIVLEDFLCRFVLFSDVNRK